VGSGFTRSTPAKARVARTHNRRRRIGFPLVPEQG
jgi:hypothetical protein